MPIECFYILNYFCHYTFGFAFIDPNYLPNSYFCTFRIFHMWIFRT